MHDMTRDEVQDRLPDLLAGRLAAHEVSIVERAVAADPELAAELAMLRAVRAAHRAVPAFDVSRIVNALPSPPTATIAPVADELAVRRNATRRPMISQRFARAAAVLVVVGGGTMVTVWSGRGAPASAPATVVRAESVAVGASGAAPAMQLGLGASIDDLSDEQLRALEDDIRSLDGVPSAEPDLATDLLAGEGA